MRRLFQVLIYYVAWGLFAVGGLLLSLLCLPLLPWAGRSGPARFVRGLLRRAFSLWAWWVGFSGSVKISWRGFDAGLPAGAIYVANHPCLVDATFLLSRIPNAFCVLKPALMRSPALGVAARVAGYEPGDNIIDLARRLTPVLRGGASLLIFPEGTRTTQGEVMGSFKGAFALLAQRAGVPVRTVLIRVTPDLVPKGRAWWKAPAQFPAFMEFEEGPVFDPAAYHGASDLVRAVETRMRELLLNTSPVDSSPRNSSVPPAQR